MSFGKPDAPAVPNYQAIGKKENQSLLRMNNPNVITPYGQQKVSYKGNRPTVNITLNKQQQKILENEQQARQKLSTYAAQMAQRAGNTYAKPFSLNQLSPITTDPSVAGREAVTQALIERNQPYMDRMREQTQNDLLIQGHNRGGEAWKNSQDDLSRSENDMRLAAILAGGQEQSRLYGLESDARTRDLQEQSFARNLPMSEYNFLQGLSQPTIPQFQPYQGVNPNMMQGANAAYQGQLNNYNAQMGGYNNFMGGLFNLGAAGLPYMLGGPAAAGGFNATAAMMGISDSRLKKNKKKLFKIKGIQWYSFEYLWDNVKRIGVMAQEVVEKIPEAVFVNHSGYMMVDYAKLR